LFLHNFRLQNAKTINSFYNNFLNLRGFLYDLIINSPEKKENIENIFTKVRHPISRKIPVQGTCVLDRDFSTDGMVKVRSTSDHPDREM